MEHGAGGQCKRDRAFSKMVPASWCDSDTSYQHVRKVPSEWWRQSKARCHWTSLLVKKKKKKWICWLDRHLSHTHHLPFSLRLALVIAHIWSPYSFTHNLEMFCPICSIVRNLILSSNWFIILTKFNFKENFISLYKLIYHCKNDGKILCRT